MNYKYLRLMLSLVLFLSVSLASPVFSKGHDRDGSDRDSGDSESDSGGDRGGLSSATTNNVVVIINRGIGGCQTLDQVYRFDCYRKTYQRAAIFLNDRPAYAGAREALISVEQALAQIMTRYGDPQTAPIRDGLRTFRPIKLAAVPRAKADLGRALDQAETVLLRAPARTGTHYARIADAVQSNKVLLRSRLYPNGIDLLQTAFA